MVNLNFLNKDSKKEFLQLYGNDADNYDVSQYTYDKASTNFDTIDDIIFDIIDEIFKCKWHNFNLWFFGVMGFQRNGIKYYYITFNFEDRDFEYIDEDTTTTEYGVQEMNKNFKYKEYCKIRHRGYEILQISVKIKNNQFYKGDD